MVAGMCQSKLVFGAFGAPALLDISAGKLDRNAITAWSYIENNGYGGSLVACELRH